MKFLRGYRTYILAGLTLCVTGLYAFSLIDLHAYTVLVGLFTGSGLATIRASIPTPSVETTNEITDFIE